MNTRVFSIISFVLTFAGSMHFAIAEEHAAGLQAHVHGLSELTIAMEKDALEIQFSSPVLNLAGFEHKATTAEDIETIESVEAKLRNYKTLFVFSRDTCEYTNVSVDVSDLIDSTDHESVDHNSVTAHDHEHGEEHEHEDHHQSEGHSDVVVNYTYQCKNTARLSAITVEFFELFPGIQEIGVMWIKEMQQGSATLTPTNRVIEMRSPS